MLVWPATDEHHCISEASMPLVDHRRAALSALFQSNFCTGDKMCRDQQVQREHDDYWEAVTDVAESVIDDLDDADDEENQDELMTCLIAEKCDQHEYVIGNDLCIHTLRFSNNACAGFFDGTFAANKYARNAPFPFVDLAADAFEADVTDKVRKLLSDE